MNSPKENKVMITDELIMNRIYVIRDTKVMLDKDLAELYIVETKVLKQQVKRNIDRFPIDFMFVLTNEEFYNLRSQSVTSSWGGSRYLPMVFTEQGVAMLSSVLNSKSAIQVNIQIMRIFTKFSKLLNDNLGLKLEIEKIKSHLNKQDKNIKLVFNLLDKLIDKKEKPRKKLGFKIPEKKK